MTGGDILWLFFILVAIQPYLKQAMLEGARKRLLAKLERKRNSRVILLIHRQETMSLLGFPIFRYIDVHDSEEVIRAIHLTADDVPIDLVLHTPGGLVLASLQIARAIKKHKGKVTVFVPFYAMSGGTLIALAADEIVMGPHAVLGPVDPQLGGMPAASIINVRKEKPVDAIDDRTLIMADVAEKAIEQVRQSVLELMEGTYDDPVRERVADLLSKGVWTHDHPISAEEAKALGLNVKTEVPEEIYELMSLYPQPVRRVPSVEYLPVPRGKDGRS